MFEMKAEINQNDIKNLLQTFSGALVRKAIRSALDKTGTWAKSYIATDVSTNFNLSASRVKKAITVIRTTQAKNEVTVSVRGKGLSTLDDFGAIQDAGGVRAYISRNQVSSWPHAFINVVKGKRVIMLRVPPTPYKKEKKRGGYPTTGKPGRQPSIPTLANQIHGRDKRNADMTNHLYQELANQIAKRTMGLQQIAEIE